MKKLLREIDKKLDKNLDGIERKDILNFYEEVINDRLEQGESIDEIRASFDLSKVSSNINNINYKKSLNSKNKSFNWLLILLIPFIFIIAVLIISLALTLIAIIFSVVVAILSLILVSIVYMIQVIVENPSIPVILFVSGIGLIVSTSMLLLMKPVIKLSKLCIEYIIKGLKWSFLSFKSNLGGL